MEPNLQQVELREMLDAMREVAGALLVRLDEDDVSAAEIVGMLESLAQLDRDRAELLRQYRSIAAAQLRRRAERSIRQYVLDALNEVGTPQVVGFLEDYLYATELVEFKSRGVGALRRDEFKAWHTDRQKDRMRVAYIVPCLDEHGRRATGWMARSDWSLARRLIVPGAEELWSVSRLVALIRAHRDAPEEQGALFTERITRYAREALGDDRVAELSSRADRYEEFEDEATTKIKLLREQVEAAQALAGERLEAEGLEEEQLWGKAGA
jgi:hypothetical protein